LEHHAVGSFDLAVALWVGDRGVVDVNKVILAEIPEDRATESFVQVGDDPIRHTEVMLDISNEFDCFFRCYFRNRSDFKSLGEFVYGDQDMFIAAQSGTKRSYRIKTPHSEGP
jgi:hypothetical protein